MTDSRDMSFYVVKLHSRHVYGLGVITGRCILTCAHYFNYYSVDRDCCLEIHNRGTPDQQHFYVQNMDSVLDFMVLGTKPLNTEAPYGGSRIPLVFPSIRPAQLVFPNNAELVSFPAYFYEPDGKTVIHTRATVLRGSEEIQMEHPVENGSSGGPVFTEDNRLIGIAQGRYNLLSKQRVGVAVRIDMAATGWLRERTGGFERINLEDLGCVEESGFFGEHRYA